MADTEEQNSQEPVPEDAQVQEKTEEIADNATAATENESKDDNNEPTPADVKSTVPEEENVEENVEQSEVKEEEPKTAEGEVIEESADGETTETAADNPPGEAEPAAAEESTDQPAEEAETGEAGEAGEGGEAKEATSEEPEGESEEKPQEEVKTGDADGEAADAEVNEETKAEGEETSTAANEETVEPSNELETEGQPEANQDQAEHEAMPQSDTFTDGEKPESPAPHIVEKLSRDGSPAPADGEAETKPTSPPVADSPREDEHIEEGFDVEALEEDIMSPEQDREALVEMYQTAITEREQLQQQNHQLQHKLAEYFKRRRSDEQKPEAVDKNEADQEQRYVKYMSQLEELRAEDQLIREKYEEEIEDLKQRCEEKNREVDVHRLKFVEFKHQVALNALNSRSGKPIPPKDIEQYLAGESKKDQDVIAVRLENIKLKNKLKKKEQQLKSKEELADGLHLIDFEQLKIENQTYNEKIEERNEELLKLRKKITNTVQVLTHLKEKLQFVQGENSLLKNKLKDVEGAVAQKRDVLTRTKQARDALRIDNHRLRQNCGLLGNEPLLRDFEERKDEADGLKERLERLKMQHAELTLNTSSVRRKIEQIKSHNQS